MIRHIFTHLLIAQVSKYAHFMRKNFYNIRREFARGRLLYEQMITEQITEELIG